MESFLAALRASGVHIGMEEEVRLAKVLAVAPPLDKEELGQLVCSIVAKSAEEHASFWRIYARWTVHNQPSRADAEPKTSHHGSQISISDNRVSEGRTNNPEYAPEPQAARVKITRLWLALGVVGLSLGIGASLYVTWPKQTSPPDMRPLDMLPGDLSTSKPQPIAQPANPIFSPHQPVDGSAEDRASRDAGVVAQASSPACPRTNIEILESPGLGHPDWLGVGIAACSLIIGLLLFLRTILLRRPGATSKSAVLPSPPVGRSDAGTSPRFLLRSREEEVLVWGIGRFVSGEASTALDIHASVTATAQAAGRPELRFLRARHQREVWLWLDESSTGLWERLAAEIVAALSEAGLPVEVARFWGSPATLSGSTGLFGPAEVEDRRDRAVVAILTDGRLLSRRLSVKSDPQLLRGLSGWPMLAFVDFGKGQHGLATLLAEYEIPVLEPAQLAGFLGGEVVSTPRRSELAGNVRCWLAACMLLARPISEDAALRLRLELSLTVEPWEIDALQRSAGRLGWTNEERTREVNWLRDICLESRTGAFLRSGRAFQDRLAGTVLSQALFCHERLLCDEEAAGTQLPLDRALLWLWDRPDQAAESLSQLRDLHEAEIRHHLRHVGPANVRRRDVVRMPWRLDELSAPTRVLLLELGLGVDEDQRRERLVWPGRLWLAIGLCAGLALGATAAGLLRWHEPQGKPLVEELERPDGGWVTVKNAGEQYILEVGVGAQRTESTVQAGARISVKWQCTKNE